MAIMFTQHLRPTGLQKTVIIKRPDEIEKLASKLSENGCLFEIEELVTGEIYMEVLNPNGDEILSSGLCKNGPTVLVTVDKMIRDAMIAFDANKNL